MYLAHPRSRVLNGHAVTMQNSWTHFCGCDKRSTGTSRRPDHESTQSCPHEKPCHAGTDGPRPIRAPQGKGQVPKNHIVCGRQDNARGCASGMQPASSKNRDGNGAGTGWVEHTHARSDMGSGYIFLPVPVPVGNNPHPAPYPSGIRRVTGYPWVQYYKHIIHTCGLKVTNL
jgi:hypothetical protein